MHVTVAWVAGPSILCSASESTCRQQIQAQLAATTCALHSPAALAMFVLGPHPPAGCLQAQLDATTCTLHLLLHQMCLLERHV
jgi:hypothetical protein